MNANTEVSYTLTIGDGRHTGVVKMADLEVGNGTGNDIPYPNAEITRIGKNTGLTPAQKAAELNRIVADYNAKVQNAVANGAGAIADQIKRGLVNYLRTSSGLNVDAGSLAVRELRAQDGTIEYRVTQQANFGR